MTDDHMKNLIEAFLREIRNVFEQAKKGKPTRQDVEALDESLKNLRDELRHALEFLWSDGGWRWENADYSDVETIKREHRQLTPCIIRAANALGDVTHFSGQDSAAASLHDVVSGDSIGTNPVADPLLSELQKLNRRHAVLDYLGCSMLVPFIGIYLFMVVDIRPLETPLQLVMASPGEAESARNHLGTILGAGQSPIEWVRREVVEIARIKSLESGTLLDEMLEAMILQALSDNHVENAMGRIHTLVIGPPASGKKLLVDAAGIMNLAFQHIGHKMSVAGLVGRSRMQKGGRYASEPGLLPLAHRGTLALEDFHAVSKSRLTEIVGHLSQVMEDGEVYDSTAAKTKAAANTSIHLDLNRASDLHPGRKDPRDDLEMLPMNIISRFDVIYDYEKDPGRMFEIAEEMLRSIRDVGPNTREDRHARIRSLQLMIAVLRDELPSIEVPEPVRERAVGYVREIQERYRPFESIYQTLSMFATRLVHGLLKLAAASARGHARPVMTEEDVTRATIFLNRKLDFICKLLSQRVPGWSTAKQWDRYVTALSRIDDEAFTVASYQQTADCSQATAYRDIEDFAANGLVRKLGAGNYGFERPQILLPPPPDVKEKLDEDYTQARADRAAEPAGDEMQSGGKPLGELFKEFIVKKMNPEQQAHVIAALERLQRRRAKEDKSDESPAS
jgi:hypothetical protein